jgi:hypothetical protein
MKTRIKCIDLGRLSSLGEKMYVIEVKRHFWNIWKIRDWENIERGLPRFYNSIQEAKEHL